MQIFTMHGTTMIFLVVMPLSVGLGNFLVPLMIGARDMAFPKLNALGYWLFLFAALFLYSSFIFGGAPDKGWFSYAPLTELPVLIHPGMTFWALAIHHARHLIHHQLDQFHRDGGTAARARHDPFAYSAVCHG